MEHKRPRGRTNGKLRDRVFAMYGFECWLCGRDGADTIDHLVMISQGGDNSLENLRPAHGRKTAYCVGNFSRKRGVRRQLEASLQPVARIIILQENWSTPYD